MHFSSDREIAMAMTARDKSAVLGEMCNATSANPVNGLAPYIRRNGLTPYIRKNWIHF